MTLQDEIKKILERAERAAPPDCGDNSCRFAPKRGGMRTNGGCRCYDRANTGLAARRYAFLLHESHADVPRLCKALLEAVEIIDVVLTELACTDDLCGVYSDKSRCNNCALRIKVQERTEILKGAE